MTEHDEPLRRRASLEVLRAEAADEREVLVHERLRLGEDPWEFMEELPSVDELVVLTMRGELIAAGGGMRPTRTAHFRMLRQIALEYPPLTRAVWRLLGDGETWRTWDATVRTVDVAGGDWRGGERRTGEAS